MTMAATVRIPTALRDLAAGSREIEVPTGRVSEVIAELATQYPELGRRLVGDEGRPRRFINIFVGEEDIRFLDGVDTEVGEGQVVTILPAVSGG
jgi:molybdopterin synthase sulfur carrier subunit